MATRNESSSSTVLLVLILIVTFPLWLALGGVLLGLALGLMGAIIGIAGGLFGALVALIVLPFKLLFGWGWHGFPHFHFNGFLIAVIIIVAALIVQGRKKS